MTSFPVSSVRRSRFIDAAPKRVSVPAAVSLISGTRSYFARSFSAAAKTLSYVQ